MGHSTARQVAQAAARRDVGLARMTAVTVSVGIAAAVGSAGLAVGLATAGSASATQQPARWSTTHRRLVRPRLRDVDVPVEDAGPGAADDHSGPSGDHRGLLMGTTSTLDRPAGADERWPDLAAAAWTALGCDVRLLVTDPAALAVAREMLEADLDALDRAASRFRPTRRCRPWQPQAGRRIPISPSLPTRLAWP